MRRVVLVLFMTVSCIVLCSGACLVSWLVLVFVAVGWLNRKSEAAMLRDLQRWAAENRYEILEYGRPMLSPWSSRGGTFVPHVRVRDEGGTTRRGWVRWRRDFQSEYSDRIEIRWDESPPAPEPAPPPPPPRPRPRDDPLWDPWVDG